MDIMIFHWNFEIEIDFVFESMQCQNVMEVD